MGVADVEPAAGPEQPGDHPRPARDVGQPVERAHTGVHEVELGAEHVGHGVELRLHEPGSTPAAVARSRATANALG